MPTDDEFEKELIAALGIEPGDTVVLVTPQFNRMPGSPEPAAPPTDRAAFEVLKDMDELTLRELGLGCWSHYRMIDGECVEEEDQSKCTHSTWLFPAEWYSSIPAGFPVVDIFGETSAFQPGVTDDDIRFGCLSFGIRITHK